MIRTRSITAERTASSYALACQIWAASRIDESAIGNRTQSSLQTRTHARRNELSSQRFRLRVNRYKYLQELGKFSPSSSSSPASFNSENQNHDVDVLSHFEEGVRDPNGMYGSRSSQPKKKRKSRTAFTNHQIFELEKRFLYQKYLSPADRDEIALSLGLTNAQVITWFQNRRARLKRDMEELKKDMDAAKMHSLHKSLLENIQEMGCNFSKEALRQAAAVASAVAQAQAQAAQQHGHPASPAIVGGHLQVPGAVPVSLRAAAVAAAAAEADQRAVNSPQSLHDVKVKVSQSPPRP